MTQPVLANEDSLALALADNISNLKNVYVNLIAAEWAALGSYRDADIPAWLNFAVPTILDAQETAAAFAEASYDLQISLLTGEEPNLPPVDYSKVTGPAIRNGTPVDEVYSRMFKDVWTSLGNGNSFDAAVQAGMNRFEEMFTTDIERVVDHTAIEKFANEHRIVGSRRVLVGEKNCALCILASTQLYHKRELKPIHPNCDCKVVPVTSADINLNLSKNLIDQVHAEIEAKFGKSDKGGRIIDYRKILLVRNHGEFGPTLTYHSDKFTGPDDLLKPAKHG